MIRLSVGIDPGYATCGIGVLTRGSDQRWTCAYSKTVLTPAKMPLHDRMLLVYNALHDLPSGLFQGVKCAESIVACEEQTGAHEGKRRRGETNSSALLVQQVVGIVRTLSYEYGGHFVEVTPAQAKAVLVGIPRTASKAQVQRAVRAIVCGCPAKMSEHESDAMAVALAGARTAAP